MDNDTNTLQEAVAAVMARIHAGDSAARWDLHDLAAPSLQRMIRTEARRCGVHLTQDDVTGLVLDATIVLSGFCRAWKPGGALPWVWAKRRITALVHEHIGQFTRELDTEAMELEAPAAVGRIDDPRAVLRSLAGDHEGALELERRLTDLVTERNAAIWLAFQIEKAAGSRSPAVTVGADHGMQPAAVRKVVQRVSECLAAAELA